MKRYIILMGSCILLLALMAACGSNATNNEMQSTQKTDIYQSKTQSSTSNVVTSSKPSVSSNTTTSNASYNHTCEVTGCYKEGKKTIVGFSGNLEYYCQNHYDEMQAIVDYMEQDVGRGSASKHQCEVSGCSKEGFNQVGVEWYCTEHYNEMINLLAEILK